MLSLTIPTKSENLYIYLIAKHYQKLPSNGQVVKFGQNDTNLYSKNQSQIFNHSRDNGRIRLDEVIFKHGHSRLF